MSDGLMLTISSANLVVFSVFLVYLMMIQWASGLNLRLFQAAAVLFVIVTFGEIIFAANQINAASGMYAWFASQKNLALYHDALYLVAGILLAVWQHGYLQELKK